MGMRLSYSLISNSCDRCVSMLLNKSKKETISNENTETGIDLHSIFCRGLTAWDFSEFTKQTGNNPMSLFSEWKGADIQTEQMVYWQVEGVEFSGKKDIRIETDYEIIIIDAKRTGWNIQKNHEKQLSYYSFKELQENPFKPVKTFIYFLEKNLLLQSKTYTADDLGILTAMMKEDIARIQKIISKGNKQYTTTGAGCAWCSYAITCVDNCIPKTVDEAVELAKQLVQCNAKSNAIEKLLKPYTEANGNISFDGQVAGWSDSNVTSVDSNGIREFCVKNSIAFEIGTTEAKKLAKQYPQLSNYIFVEAGKPKFGVKKEGAK